MAFPSNILAAGWIAFVVILLLILLFSFIYIRCFQHRSEKELCSTITSILGLSVALATCALMPVDIFLVSYMKEPNGEFKSWAQDNDTRQFIQNNLMNAYYGLYGCIVIFIFILLPFAYFFYEEQDEETTCRSRCLKSSCYVAVFLLFAAILILIGAFVPFGRDMSINGTDTIGAYLINFGESHGENAISFILGVLTIVGVLCIVFYSAIGMSSWPIDEMKGFETLEVERETLMDEQEEARRTADHIRNTSRRSERSLSSLEQRLLDDSTDQDYTLRRRLQYIEDASRSCCWRFTSCMRPFQVAFSFIFILLPSLLVFATLLITNIDKQMHSLGWKFGYALPDPKIFNPMDKALLYLQKVFPVDYIFVGLITMFLFFASMAGIKKIGIWFCWLRMYKIRVRGTKPQGLLFLCFLLMFVVMALNVIIHQMVPQYGTYGSQHYMVGNWSIDYPNDTWSTAVPSNASHVTYVTYPCSLDAGSDVCVMTCMSVLLNRFFLHLWFFGVAYQWMIWAFLLVYLISFLVTVIRKRRRIADEIDDDDDDILINA